MKTPDHLWTDPAHRSKRLLGIEARPVLVDPEGNIVAEGRLGDTHRQVFCKALATAENDTTRMRLIDALANDAQHRFSLATANGKPIFDENGMRIIVDRIEAGRIADATGQRSQRYLGTPLHSQQLRITGIAGHARKAQP